MNRRRQDLQSMDIDSWPSVDTNALAAIERATFERRRSAIALYAKGGAARVIEKQTGINSRQLYHLLDRCLKQSDDGAVCGFRGLLKHKRVESYRRTAAIRATDADSGSGLVGAFVLLLERYPTLSTWLPSNKLNLRHPNSGQSRARSRVLRFESHILPTQMRTKRLTAWG